MITWSPLLPTWLVLGAGLVAASAAIAIYRRPVLPLILRLAGIGVVTVMLLNPVRQISAPTKSTPLLAIAVDCSGSMVQADAGPQQSSSAAAAGNFLNALGQVSPNGSQLTRGEAARATAQSLVTALGGTWRVQVSGFSRALVSPVPGQDAGDSDFAALAGFALQEPKPAALVVISDGADWAGADPETALAGAGIPVHALGVGSTTSGMNVGVILQVPSPSLAPGQEVPLTVEVTATPSLVGRTSRLVVERIPALLPGDRLLETEVTLAPWQRFEVRDQVGTALGGRLWKASVIPLPGEATVVDNSAFGAAQVVDRTLRVLVIEGRPYWDTNFLVRGWRRDRQIQVDTAYAVAQGTWKAGIDALPPKAEILANYDVLVLGQGVDRLAPAADLLETWIDRGGRLILLGTTAIPALEGLDPLKLEGTAVDTVLDPGGELLSGNATVNAMVAPATTRPQTRVLLGTREHPAAGLRRVGSGVVLRLNVDGLWRWHLGPAGRESGERFCREVLRTAARAPNGDLWAERLRLGPGESATLWTRPDSGIRNLRHTRPDGTTRDLTMDGPGLRLALDEPGVHRFANGSQQVTVVVEQRLGEQLNSARDDGRLRRLGERTGGSARDLQEWQALADRLVARQQLGGIASRSEPLISDRWWLGCVLFVVALEWWIRRRTHGLV